MKPSPMMPDHYATLGVDSTASATTIRAAYLALMREYHPDRNPSPEAVARAQAAVAAFKVLGDFDRRNHYDWDRRREREAVAALAEQRPRGKRSGALAASAVGLAAVGAWAFMPPSAPEPAPIKPPTAEAKPAAVEKTKTASPPKRVAVAPPAQPKIETPAHLPKVEPRSQPVRVAKIEPLRPKPKIERTPVVRMAAAKAPAPRPVPPPPPRLAKAVAKPVQPAAKPATDLASLDQFVMNFYGQSWRHGDAPRRAALVQSRDNFITRRGSCSADACKRAAYLKLMRDVSEIVETGEPKAR